MRRRRRRPGRAGRGPLGPMPRHPLVTVASPQRQQELGVPGCLAAARGCRARRQRQALALQRFGDAMPPLYRLVGSALGLAAPPPADAVTARRAGRSHLTPPPTASLPKIPSNSFGNRRAAEGAGSRREKTLSLRDRPCRPRRHARRRATTCADCRDCRGASCMLVLGAAAAATAAGQAAAAARRSEATTWCRHRTLRG